MSSKKGVRVRGTCRAKHVTEATSAPGRVTWEGVCATEGCELPVHGRRIPGDAGKPPPTARTAAAGEAGTGYQVKEITGYASTSKQKQPGRGRGGDDGGAANVPAAGAPQQPAGAADGAGDGPEPDQQPAGPPEPDKRPVDAQRRDPVGRWSGSSRVRAARERGRERAARRREAEADWIIPNVIPR